MRVIASENVFDVIESCSDWIGRFSVVTDSRIRMRSLPENKGTT